MVRSSRMSQSAIEPSGMDGFTAADWLASVPRNKRDDDAVVLEEDVLHALIIRHGHI